MMTQPICKEGGKKTSREIWLLDEAVLPAAGWCGASGAKRMSPRPKRGWWNSQSFFSAANGCVLQPRMIPASHLNIFFPHCLCFLSSMPLRLRSQVVMFQLYRFHARWVKVAAVHVCAHARKLMCGRLRQRTCVKVVGR
jgi:hypothetical protein